MKSMKSQMVVALVSLLLWGASFAVAIPYKLANKTIQETNPSSQSLGTWDLDWSHVHKYKNSSAVAVASHWLLTAAHVANDGGTGAFTIGATTYTPQETRYYDGTATGSTTSTDATRDLALVRLDNALPGYYSYATSTNAYHGDDVIVVGYGNSGAVTQTTTSGSWTEVILTADQRWGTNNIDGSVTNDWSGSYGAEFPSMGTYSMYRTTISETDDSTNTDYETGFNTYDSGGPMFAKVGGTWTIVGINVLRGGDTPPPYTTTYSVRVGDYDTWIADTVPEPATMALLALGGIAMLKRRRK